MLLSSGLEWGMEEASKVVAQQGRIDQQCGEVGL
jgi:hypothetical protein